MVQEKGLEDIPYKQIFGKVLADYTLNGHFHRGKYCYTCKVSEVVLNYNC